MSLALAPWPGLGPPRSPSHLVLLTIAFALYYLILDVLDSCTLSDSQLPDQLGARRPTGLGAVQGRGRPPSSGDQVRAEGCGSTGRR